MAEGRSSSSGRGGDGGDGGDGGGAVVELGLRLWTGSSTSSSSLSAEAEASTAVAAAPTRSWMTILYGGRMCAVGVTQIQAMEIITMANQQLIQTKQQQQHGSRCHPDGQPDSSSSTTTSEQQTKTALQRRGSGSPPASSSSPSCHQAARGVAAALATISHEATSTAPELSMKRSLQRFLLKRKTRAAAAVGSPYARPTTH